MRIASRRVSDQRRIGLPLDLAIQCGIRPGHWVTVLPEAEGHHTLLVEPSAEPLDGARRRDPSRPRRVTTVMQVTIPDHWMAQLGMRPKDWVFLRPLESGPGMAITPQSRVRLRPARSSRRYPRVPAKEASHDE